MLRALTSRSRRILMTVDAVGGVWRYALDLTRTLVRDGDSVVLAGLGPQPSPQQCAEARSIASLIWLNTPPDWMTRDPSELTALSQELREPIRNHAIDLVHLNAPTQAAGLDVACPVVAVSHSCVLTWFHAVKGDRPRVSGLGTRTATDPDLREPMSSSRPAAAMPICSKPAMGPWPAWWSSQTPRPQGQSPDSVNRMSSPPLAGGMKAKMQRAWTGQRQ
ncbi:glycosyltransferase family 4 protein [Mesorhizobium sp. M8A.F.Ca.ET.057.01.1.1]|uniref:glycosyltransferase family 4 protein n=1 Tax=Mesorhizobium sp. M8A.F.Ca.ET.057.01.1.1 TaxID=2493679 RepID=UPI001FE2416C|nr:glycosyltransferase family 4 protein [Mesorhizobium sp. M8A.F.Ca.ET.057.01.1.1]